MGDKQGCRESSIRKRSCTAVQNRYNANATDCVQKQRAREQQAKPSPSISARRVALKVTGR